MASRIAVAAALRPRTAPLLLRHAARMQAPRPLASQSSLLALQRPASASITSIRFYADTPRSRDQPSKNLSELGQNAKKEAQGAVGSVMEAVGGSGGKRGGMPADNPPEEGSTGEVVTDLKSMEGLVEAVPRGAIIFGAAGLIPYFATSATTIFLARNAWLADQGADNFGFDTETALALLYHNESIQVAYGAVILSFLGAIHWGMEFSGRGGYVGTRRYLLGIFPVALAWPTVLLPGTIALATQWAAFTAVWYTDMLATSKGWAPKWYSTYRFGLTAVVGSLILLTLGATNYYTPKSEGAITTGEKLQRLRDKETGQTKTEGPASGVKIKGKLPKGGSMESSSGDDAFVKFTNVEEKRKKEEEERKKKEEEEAKEKQEGEKKKKK